MTTSTEGRARRTPAAVLVVLLLVLTGLLAAPARADDAGFVQRVNSERAVAGLAPLASDAELARVAQSWAEHMAATGDLAHNPDLADQVRGYRYTGENVGYGPDVATIHAAFMASPSHRANVLEPGYSQVGIAVVTGSGGRLWVAEVFREPASSGSAEWTATAPPLTPEQQLQQRAAAAAAGPGSAQAPDVLAEVVRFTQVLQAVRATS